MAGTTITNLLEIIQRKIDAADSTSATQDLLYLLSAVRQGDGSSLELYDSTGAFPDLTDSAADTEMIAYKLDSDRLYFNVGVWKGKTLPPPPPPPPPPAFQGSNFGYSSGGFAPTGRTNVIEKFSFTSDANATDVGDLTAAKSLPAGQRSADNGYISGGSLPPDTNVIEKFPFASDTNATDIADLTVARDQASGQSSSENGYTSGGNAPVGNVIDKFPFSSDTNATDVGNLSTNKNSGAGQSSTTDGYFSGGRNPAASPSTLSIIDKFPFATDANATYVADLSVGRYRSGAGQSSTTHGYTSGGNGTTNNIIDKFTFASDANATDVGDLTRANVYDAAGQSSTVSGYVTGGTPPVSNVIEKFPFSSDTNASDVGDLTETKYGPAGQQY